MAVNRGKFIDRSPIICAAGKPTNQTETVASALQDYRLVDATTACLHSANIWKEDVFVPPLQPPNFLHPNFKEKSEISHVLQAPVQTRYETLLEDLRDTSRDSYWNKEVGKGRDQVAGLPKGMNPVEVTFGMPGIRETSVKELINPPKTHYEIMYDSQVGHEMYKKTHNDYNPGEQISRHYTSPYCGTNCFGKKTKYDPRGIWVRCCCDWHYEPVIYGTKIEADLNERTKHHLGKVLAPNNNIKSVPKGHAFGKPSIRVLYGVEELLKEGEPCLFKRDFHKWLSALNKTRVYVKEKVRKGLIMDDIYKRTLYFDKEKRGLIPLKLFSDLCSCPEINIRFEDFIPLLEFLEIITKEGDIYYKIFLNIINCDGEPFELKCFQDIPKEHLHFVTTNQAAACDYLIIDNSKSPVAGVPTVRIDLPRPITYPGMCRADLESLGDYTSVNTLLNPSIYCAYGLNFRDFFQSRSPEVIRKLFENIGYNFPGDTFEELWQQGLELDNRSGVCVDTFKKLVEKRFPPPSKLLVDELDCKRYI